MNSSLFRPWRQLRTWWSLSHVVLDLILGAITFSLVLTLLTTTAGLLPVFPAAIPVGWLLFAVAAGLGRIERSRFRALLDVDIPDPHRPLTSASWWSRLKERARTGSRWREIGYLLLLLPLSALTVTVTLVAWCGSLALTALPAYVGHLPRGAAQFGLFSVGPGAGAAIACVVGIAGLILLAPWVTLAMAGLDAAIGRRLLGPSRREEFSTLVTQLEARRSAAVDSAEAERRRIERDLHDGAQQRLVSLAMDLGLAGERFDTDPQGARELVTGAHEEAKAALADLRDLARGLHPAILADRGLDAALSAVVARSPVPVTLDVDVADRPPPAVESTAYFVVAEALANVAKHADASRASVTIARRQDRLVVEVADDGAGGADPLRGTGLRGLAERVAALGGWMRVISPPGGPTTLLVEVPCAS